MTVVGSHLDATAIRRRLGRKSWGVPSRFGPAGWIFQSLDQAPAARGSVIITLGYWDDDQGGAEWVHASISWLTRMPSYDDLKLLHQAVWPDGYAHQVFVPPAQHVNIAGHALHLWGREDGARVLPEFGHAGTI